MIGFLFDTHRAHVAISFAENPTRIAHKHGILPSYRTASILCLCEILVVPPKTKITKALK